MAIIARVSHLAHHATAPKTTRCRVVTVSDTRTEETDRGGRAIVELLSAQGHDVAGKTIVPDDADRVRGALQAGIETSEVDVVIATGGTGITRRDGTYVLWVERGDGKTVGRRGRSGLRFLNHSGKPNAEFDGDRLYARRVIRKDEEITFHYGEEWEDVP